MKKQYNEPKIKVITIRPREVVLQVSTSPSVDTGDEELTPSDEGDAGEEGLSKGRNNWDVLGE